jgi:hypothetical protein
MVLVLRTIVVPIISSDFILEPLLIILDYQQWHTFNGSKIVSDGGLEPLSGSEIASNDNLESLQMIFSVVVKGSCPIYYRLRATPKV